MTTNVQTTNKNSQLLRAYGLFSIETLLGSISAKLAQNNCADRLKNNETKTLRNVCTTFSRTIERNVFTPCFYSGPAAADPALIFCTESPHDKQCNLIFVNAHFRQPRWWCSWPHLMCSFLKCHFLFFHLLILYNSEVHIYIFYIWKNILD